MHKNDADALCIFSRAGKKITFPLDETPEPDYDEDRKRADFAGSARRRESELEEDRMNYSHVVDNARQCIGK